MEVKIRDLVDGLLRNRVTNSLIRKYDWNWEQRASSQYVEERKEGRGEGLRIWDLQSNSTLQEKKFNYNQVNVF